MNEFFDQAQRLTEMWGDMAAKMTAAGLSATANAASDPQATPADATRGTRDALLNAAAQQADQYMRSPQFLAAMKQSLDNTIQLREQLNAFFTKLHHDVLGVAQQDVDQLLRSMRHVEQRLTDGHEHLMERVEQILVRLEALEKGGAKRTGRKTPAKRNGRGRKGGRP